MSKEKKFAVVLSGCGVFDGAEIHETTMTLYAIASQGHSYQIFAPDIEQHHVINHITGDVMDEKRNVLVESARIAKGDIKPLSEYKPTNFDALVFPGGFGAAKNLSSFAFEGSDCKVIPEVERVIKETHSNKKPIGALCISPVMLAKTLGDVTLTLGKDNDTAKAIVSMGAKHEVSSNGEVVSDRNNLVFTTPCYMLDATIVDIANDANAIIKAISNHI